MVTALADRWPTGRHPRQPAAAVGWHDQLRCVRQGRSFHRAMRRLWPADRLVHRRAGLLDRLERRAHQPRPAQRQAGLRMGSRHRAARLDRGAQGLRAGLLRDVRRAQLLGRCLLRLAIGGDLRHVDRRRDRRRLPQGVSERARSDEAPPGDDRRDPHQDRRAARRPRASASTTSSTRATQAAGWPRSLPAPCRAGRWIIRRNTARSRRSDHWTARIPARSTDQAPFTCTYEARRDCARSQ